MLAPSILLPKTTCLGLAVTVPLEEGAAPVASGHLSLGISSLRLKPPVKYTEQCPP